MLVLLYSGLKGEVSTEITRHVLIGHFWVTGALLKQAILQNTLQLKKEM